MPCSVVAAAESPASAAEFLGPKLSDAAAMVPGTAAVPVAAAELPAAVAELPAAVAEVPVAVAGLPGAAAQREVQFGEVGHGQVCVFVGPVSAGIEFAKAMGFGLVPEPVAVPAAAAVLPVAVAELPAAVELPEEELEESEGEESEEPPSWLCEVCGRPFSSLEEAEAHENACKIALNAREIRAPMETPQMRVQQQMLPQDSEDDLSMQLADRVLIRKLAAMEEEAGRLRAQIRESS